MAGRLWREAATVMLISRKRSKPCDYNVLMVGRSPQSQFMSNALVFPGGVTCPTDLIKDWRGSVFTSRFSNRDPNSVILNLSKVNRPLLIRNQSPFELERDIALRITAVRELFEETGILLRDPKTTRIDPNVLDEWRHKVNKDPDSFLEMCINLKICPDIWSLYEWSAWLTPIGLSDGAGRRFDTIFYIAFISEDELDHFGIEDGSEISSVSWKEPLEYTTSYYYENAWLAPPQLYELARLVGFTSWTSLRDFAINRSNKGCISTFPIRASVRFDQGIFYFLPGDTYYPESPDIENGIEMYEVDQEYKDIMKYSSHHNRMFKMRDSKYGMLPFVNIQDPHGHVNPVRLVEFMPKTAF